MIVVADSSPLISLAVLDKLELLHQLFDEIYIPLAVYNEITVKNKSHARRLQNFASPHVLRVQDKKAVQKLLKKLDIGEAEAIILARENNFSVILIDENKGRKIARAYGLSPIGAITVLLLAKERGLIAKIKPELDKLVFNHRRISSKLYDEVLMRAGEK